MYTLVVPTPRSRANGSSSVRRTLLFWKYRRREKGSAVNVESSWRISGWMVPSRRRISQRPQQDGRVMMLRKGMDQGWVRSLFRRSVPRGKEAGLGVGVRRRRMEERLADAVDEGEGEWK